MGLKLSVTFEPPSSYRGSAANANRETNHIDFWAHKARPTTYGHEFGHILGFHHVGAINHDPIYLSAFGEYQNSIMAGGGANLRSPTFSDSEIQLILDNY